MKTYVYNPLDDLNRKKKITNRKQQLELNVIRRGEIFLNSTYTIMNSVEIFYSYEKYRNH